MNPQKSFEKQFLEESLEEFLGNLTILLEEFWEQFIDEVTQKSTTNFLGK